MISFTDHFLVTVFISHLLDPRVARLPLENFTKSNAVANWVHVTTLLNNAMSQLTFSYLETSGQFKYIWMT